MSNGTCVRATDGGTISAVSWVEGNEVFSKILIVRPNNVCEQVTLTGVVALEFAANLRKTILPVETE